MGSVRTMRRASGVIVLILVAACGLEDSSPLGDGPSDPTASSTTTSSLELGSLSTSPTEPVAEQERAEDSPSTSDRGTPNAERVPVSQPPVVGEVPGELLEAILLDAENRTGIATDEWTVVRSEAVNWSDGSLGCPEPGVAYTQAEVQGYWVEIAAQDQHLDYRADDRGNFKLCDDRVESPTEGTLPGDSVGPPTTIPDS